VDLDLYQLCYLPGRHPDCLSDWYAFRGFALGKNLWLLAPAGIFRNLVFLGVGFSLFPASLEKNFGFYKNFVCIW